MMAAEGKHLTIEDVQEIIDALETRSQNFPGEPFEMTLMLVLLNVGDRETPVECAGGEWTGVKKDLTPDPDGGIPKCPDGHPLYQGDRITLGWVKAL